MRIALLSDLHLTENGVHIWGVDTLGNFNKAIEKIRREPDLDAIVIAGDLSNDGSFWTYKYVDDKLNETGIPSFCCPGNHDSISMMMNEYTPSYFHRDTVSFIGEYKLILLNSVVPDDVEMGKNKSRGWLFPGSFELLRQELSDGKPAIVVLHHPPIEPGGWLNRKLLDNRDDFNCLLENFDNVRLVMYGHTHFFLESKIHNALYVAPSGVGFAFDKDLQKFEIADGQEGYIIIDITSERIDIVRRYL